MKTHVVSLVILVVLLTSCTPKMSAQEIEATKDALSAVPVSEVTITPTFVVTEAPTSTSAPIVVPSSTPPGCVILLTPLDGAEIPPIGKITFSWSPIEGASFYVLDIIQPSGVTVSFETKQTFRDQYMEAFWTGGSYQWRVIAFAQDRKRNEICRSELATFSKPASAPPPQTDNDDGKKR